MSFCYPAGSITEVYSIPWKHSSIQSDCPWRTSSTLPHWQDHVRTQIGSQHRTMEALSYMSLVRRFSIVSLIPAQCPCSAEKPVWRCRAQRNMSHDSVMVDVQRPVNISILSSFVLITSNNTQHATMAKSNWAVQWLELLGLPFLFPRLRLGCFLWICLFHLGQWDGSA